MRLGFSFLKEVEILSSGCLSDSNVSEACLTKKEKEKIIPMFYDHLPRKVFLLRYSLQLHTASVSSSTNSTDRMGCLTCKYLWVAIQVSGLIS